MKTFLSMCVIVLLWVNTVSAAIVGNAVEVSVITDNGWSIPFYMVKSTNVLKKVYAEAVKGNHYRIVVKNNLNRRVGVVVAVDGRNIISGQKSWLRNTERMYILDPYVTNEYSGWRTGQNRVNRFYFTDVPDSYVAAFGDQSAMGVIAVTVYPEIRRYEQSPGLSYSAREKRAQDGAMGKAAPSPGAEASENAGTGFGREEYSPSWRVQFDPESRAVESILIKYEWRENLCRKNIINCGRTYGHYYNRLWDNESFAPPPPGLR
ncbi:MAG TPA: hypothetical protein DDY17_01170 [Syntrophaceae bacterium]|jgi:hypothetical protein|nr:hypothetical protein [Syntrophaceae bacterium]